MLFLLVALSDLSREIFKIIVFENSQTTTDKTSAALLSFVAHERDNGSVEGASSTEFVFLGLTRARHLLAVPPKPFDLSSTPSQPPSSPLSRCSRLSSCRLSRSPPPLSTPPSELLSLSPPPRSPSTFVERRRVSQPRRIVSSKSLGSRKTAEESSRSSRTF